MLLHRLHHMHAAISVQIHCYDHIIRFRFHQPAVRRVHQHLDTFPVRIRVETLSAIVFRVW